MRKFQESAVDKDLFGTLKKMQTDSDRSIVILSLSTTDALLGELIRKRFEELSNHAGEKFLDDLFDDDSGVLGTFGSRIDIAHAIGLFSKTEMREYLKLKRIRNVFAHNTLDDLNLDTPHIADCVRSLTIPSEDIVESIEVAADNRPRARFVGVVGAYNFILQNTLRLLHQKYKL